MKGPVKMKRKTRFTLIELLIVIAIIALLAAMLLPALGKVKDQGRRTSCVNNLKQMSIQMMNYTNTFNDYVVPCTWFVTDLPNAFNRALFWYHIVAGNYGGSKEVRQGKFSPKVLRCPADPSPKKLSEVTGTLSPNWQEYHAEWQISYGWAHSAGYALSKKSHEIVADQQMFKIGRTKYKPTISVIAYDRMPTSVGDYVMKFEYAVSISTLSRTDNYYNQFPVRHNNKDNFLMLDGHVKTAYHKKMNMDGYKRVTQK